jgi:hypothetical protein
MNLSRWLGSRFKNTVRGFDRSIISQLTTATKPLPSPPSAGHCTAAATRAAAPVHHGLLLGLDEQDRDTRQFCQESLGRLFLNFNLMAAVAGQNSIGFTCANASSDYGGF